jgi:hypothetical protein
MKRRHFNITMASVILGGLAACGGGDDAPMLSVLPDGTSSIDPEVLLARLDAYPVTPLSTAEAESLAFMREEEQLAHAVYDYSATLYAPVIFDHIADSEATHTAAVETLLERYRLPDPLQGLPEGTFYTPAFQDLYNALTAVSRVSLIEALKVGVQIEELDIRDIVLQQAIVDNADILMVYDNLIRGSRNHLRSFMKTLTDLGGSYTPQYISQAEFDAILASPMEGGR